MPVVTAAVEVVKLDRTISVVGSLMPRDEATVGAQVEGQVQTTFVDFGDTVTNGQELAQIDTDSYEALARQAAAAVAKAKANALNAEHNLKRVLQLQKDNISSASDFDIATAQAEQGRADVKAAEAAEAISQLNLRRSHARAAFNGSIAERFANSGDYVKIGAALFRLVNDTELKFTIQVPERYASQVKPDQVVRLTVDAWPNESFEGKVYLINPSIAAATRSFNVAARVLNPARKLKANTFGRGELILERDVSTPVVPLEAIVNFAGITKVFVIEGTAAHTREVKIGRVSDGRQEILEGLKAGELVAVVGQTKLYEGAKIRVQSSTLNAANK